MSSKPLIIAAAEFNAAVRTKAFLISVILMPLLIGGSIAAQKLVEGSQDGKARKLAVVDHTGLLYGELAAAADAWNAAGAGPPFLLEQVKPADLEETRLELSRRVKAKDLWAFVEIPATALDPDAAGSELAYHSDNPTYEDLRRWLELTINQIIRVHRFQNAKVDAALVLKLEQPVPSEHLGLWTRAADGTLRQAEKVDKVRTYGIPIILMMLLFMIIMTIAPQLLNSVLEEKMSRISEVLLGSVTPFELMLGKLIGSVGVCLVLSSLYVGGGAVAAAQTGYLDAFPLAIMPWFVLFLVLAVLFYGALFIAVGSACSNLKDAQSAMTPVMLLTVFPMFVWTAVLKSPDSPLSIGFSLFPPATPFLMMLRQSLHPPPPVWQVLAGVTLSILSTMTCVWAAGKIFRTGILMQGKSAGFREMVRWVFTK